LKRGVLFDAARARDAGREAADHRELVLALADNGHAIGKMPGIGLHCELRADDEPYPYHGKGSTRAFLERHLAREKGLSIVETPIGPRPRFRDASGPLASIIIPFRDRSDLLEMCVNAIFQITVYPNYEILLVDNDSRETATAELLRRFEKDPRVRVLRARGAFHYSRINNRAAADAKGAVLVFMNNDVRVLADRWLDEIVGQTARSGVGCVGGKLLHDDGSIQHAGVVVGLFGGLAGHLFARRQEPFVPPAWLRYTRETTAVTAALMGVRAETFRAVGGFDETFEMTGNDVDLCLRLRARGFRNLWVPDVVAFHLEKQSRKEIPVRKNDVKRSQEAYRPYLQEGDPFYPRLASLAKGDLSPGVGGERGGGGAPAVPVSGRAERAAEIGVPARPAAPVSEERGFLAAYDARPEALETNRRLLDRFRNERHVKAGVVSWFVPAFDHAYRGGIHTALRIADHLSRHEGSLNRFVVFGGKPLDPGVARQVREAFPELRFELLQPGPGGEIPPSDVGICTLWTTAYHLLRYDRCCGKFYLVQDFEPAFYAGGSLYGLVEETYRFGYWGLCNTPGVREAYAAYGSPAMYFVPGIDRSIHRPGKPREPEPVRIVFYARPSKARNAFELGLAAFRALKQEYGRRIEILCVGEDFAPSAHDAAGIVRVPGLLPDMEAVADLYRTCDIGVVFMFSRHPSYQPFEYMACGCATVTNQNEANAWFFRDGENALLTAPTVSAVVSAIRRLIEDRALRRRIVEGGLRTTAALDWDRELDRIRRYILTGEE
jgi:GT2 family glycosyltransferase/glycosyltransferase involved in cell wall biosynthesis